MSDPATCAHCKGPMKPLFTGFYCPKDCDRPAASSAKSIDEKQKEIAEQIDKLLNNLAKPKLLVKTSGPWSGGGLYFPVGAGNKATSLPDRCRDFYCSGKGRLTHTSSVQGLPGSLNMHFECNICQKVWSVPFANSQQATSTPPTVNYATF